MGLLDFLFSSNQSISPGEDSTPKDKRKAECPYCHGELKKVPGSKTRCPQCGEFMFVRTRSSDLARVVVTKNQANEIEEAWSIKNGTHVLFLAEKKKEQTTRKMLRKQFNGKEPSKNDVAWSLLNKELLKHMKNGDWGLYRNTRFNMAEILRKEKRLKDALGTYLEVCYLDVNGPNNTGGLNDPELLVEFPPFNPSDSGFLAPGVITIVKKTSSKLGMDTSAIEKLFCDFCSRKEKSLHLPISVREAWTQVKDALV